jgi:hypothetical protein
MARRPWLPSEEIRSVSWTRAVMGKCPTKITMENGSELFIVLGDDPKSWVHAESTNFDFVIRDEGVGDITLAGTLVMRLGTAVQQDLDGTRPGGGWQCWSVTEFMPNKEVADERRRCLDETQPDHRRFKLTTDTNPACATEARGVLGNAMSAREAAKRVYGTRNASEDMRVYGEQLDPDRHYMTTSWNIEPQDNILLAMDPGVHVKHPFGIGVFAMRGDYPDRVVGIGYFHAVLTHGKDLLRDVAAWLPPGRPIQYVAYDPAANQTEKATNKPLIDSIIEWMQELGMLVTGDYLAGSNRHKPTIAQVREFLDPRPWDKSYAPRLMFDPSGPGMDVALEEMENYAFNPKTNDVIKLEDTYPDLTRYLVTTDPIYEPVYYQAKPTSKHPVERVMLGDTRDMTPDQIDYYRQMEDIIKYQEEVDPDIENDVFDIYGGAFRRAVS